MTTESINKTEQQLGQHMSKLQLTDASATDVVTLNAGGKLFATQRRTLCIVEESMLALMFGGSWPEGAAARDAAGHIFLDVDPSLFEVVLNWLRRFSMSSAATDPLQHTAVHEPEVPPDKVEHMLALLDYLQLHRHVPLRYQERFNPTAVSPFMLVHAATATRTRTAPAHPGNLKMQGVRSTLMQFAVSVNAFFDMAVDITLEVATFANSRQQAGSSTEASAAASRPSDYMFVGFVHRDTVCMLGQAGNINTQLTKLPSCYGWLTGRGVGYQVRNGKRSALPCHRGGLMWQQGDQLLLSLDCRRQRGQAASITLANTATGLTMTMAASPSINESSNAAGAAEAANGVDPKPQQPSAAPGPGNNANSSSSSRKPRPGMRHRAARLALAAGPDRDEVLELLRRQPAGVEAQVGELVAGAALQLLEARGFGVDEALAVLRQPGWLRRLAEQVGEYVLQQQQPPPPGQQQQEQQRPGQQEQEQRAAQGRAAAGPAAAGGGAAGDDGVAAAGPSPGGGNASAAGTAAAAAAAVPSGRAGDNGVAPVAAADEARVQLPWGPLLPVSSSEYEWVLVVGLVHPSDSVRIVSARRRGQHPGSLL